MQVVVLEYSQRGAWFHRALLESVDLQETRAALEEAEMNPMLPSGAKIFVAPEDFQAVVQHLSEGSWRLKGSHVVVAAALEEQVRAVVERARATTSKRERGRGSCTVKDRIEVDVHLSHYGVPETAATAASSTPFLVKRTFVHIPIPNSMRSGSSFHPASAMW